MGGFKIRIPPVAEAELQALPFPLRRQINQKIRSLKQNPFPERHESFGAGRCRLRLRGCGILYLVREAEALVTVLAIVA
jgi:mRNA-degrading endonuclease RelE of RelBE toxin-antitoxin system